MPIRRGNGKPAIVYDRSGKTPLYCPIHWVVRQENIDDARRVYGLWWSGLDDLVRQLRASLRRFAVTGPRVEKIPGGGLDLPEKA